MLSAMLSRCFKLSAFVVAAFAAVLLAAAGSIVGGDTVASSKIQCWQLKGDLRIRSWQHVGHLQSEVLARTPDAVRCTWQCFPPCFQQAGARGKRFVWAEEKKLSKQLEARWCLGVC